MADIQTHLRELGVLVGIKNKINNLGYTSNSITTNDFCEIIDSILPVNKHPLYNNIRIIAFSKSERDIIDNAFTLAKVIVEKLNFTSLDSADWYGYESGKDEPYDIKINDKYFSLKEDSFILENMGLYKLLNCFTGSKYKRGKRHIFEDYAPTEYNHWFDITWQCLLSYLSANGNLWTYTNPKNTNKQAKISIVSNDVLLEYFDEEEHKISKLPIKSSFKEFKRKTTPDIREGGFSKFINEQLRSNSAYNEAQRQCAIVASDALANELMANLNYKAGIARFLRMHKNSYYYAKTTSSGVELYEVPSANEIDSTIKITSIVGSVPSKQANILTTVKNIKTEKTLVLRNECRFSHGQFNGTPEAKLYYEQGGSLDVIYNKI
ncbi:MAG: hypothetical protein GX896_08620 [Clostridiales bacterium]|nr:hypothetical protein [Clostridiales bacterium]